MAGGVILAACQPKIVEVEKVVTKEVEKVVKETVLSEKVVKETIIIAGTPQTIEKVVTATAGPPQEVELIYTTWRPLVEQEIMDKTFRDKFTAENPHIKIKIIGAGYVDYYKKIVTMAAGGTPMDAIHVDCKAWGAAWAAEGLLVDITEELANSAKLSEPELFFPDMDLMVQYKGKSYSIPFGLSVMGLFYNTDMFDAAGVEYPNANWRPEDVTAAAAKLTTEDQMGVIVAGGEWALTWFGAKIVDNDFDPKKCTLDDPVAFDAINWAGQTYYNYAPKDAVFMTGNEFYQKRLAMKFFWGSQIPMNRMNMKDDNWDVFPTTLLSPVPLNQQGMNTSLHSQGMGAATRFRSETWTFLEWLSTDYVPDWARDMGFAVPAIRKVAFSDAYIQEDLPPKNMRAFVEQMNSGKTPGVLHVRRNEIMEIFSRECGKVDLQIAKAEEVLPPIVPLIDALLAPES
jgi:multiple sugar transport system substrate-binding protein